MTSGFWTEYMILYIIILYFISQLCLLIVSLLPLEASLWFEIISPIMPDISCFFLLTLH